MMVNEVGLTCDGRVGERGVERPKHGREDMDLSGRTRRDMD